MQTVVTQRIGTQYPHYPKTEKKEAEKPLQNEVEFSVNGEHLPPNYVEIPIDREKTLQSIAFLTQYMEDLKAGKPVENMSPSNDPWFLVPENIAIMIESDKELLNPNVKFIEANSLKDLIGEWDTE